VAVIVFDADVLIGYLNRADPHHEQAIERVRLALASAAKRMVSVVNYAELLVGPLRSGGRAGADAVDAMVSRFAIEVIAADRDLGRRAASIGRQSALKLPDAFAVATASRVRDFDRDDVRLESFDTAVLKAFADLGSSDL
jgi:predicted nucleic acid-binding protein